MNSKEILESIQKDIKEACSGFVGKKIVGDAKVEFRKSVIEYLKDIDMVKHIKVKTSMVNEDIIDIELIPLDHAGEIFIKEFKERE